MSNLSHDPVVTLVEECAAEPPISYEEVFGMPPLVGDERAEEYARVAKSILAAIRPRDAVEVFLVRDFVDHMWTCERYKRYKSAVIEVARINGIRSFLADAITPEVAERQITRERLAIEHKQKVEFLTWRCYNGGLNQNEELENIFKAYPVDAEMLKANGFSIDIATVERLDSMIEAEEVRRRNTMRELTRHREMLASVQRWDAEVLVETDGRFARRAEQG